MPEQRMRRPSRCSGYARCFISRRRERTKGITVSESLDVSLSRRCILACQDRMRGGGEGGARAEGPRNESNGVATNSSKSLSHPRVDICPGIVRPRPYVCSLSGAPNSLVAGRDREQTKASYVAPYVAPPPPSPCSDAGNIWQRGSMNRAILLRFPSQISCRGSQSRSR